MDRLVVTLGKFDGVHLGHQAVVRATTRLADRLEATPAALVLAPDPRTVLFGQRVPVLTALDQRLQLLTSCGLAKAEVLEFTTDVSALSAETFALGLGARLGGGLAGIVVGEDFRFGAGRSGSPDTLQGLGQAAGFVVEAVPAAIDDGQVVSSGRIRGLVMAGRVEEAGQLLGRPFRLTGTVVHGAARGRDLGFPTANLALVADYVYPANGIYTVRVAWRDAERPAELAGEGFGLASVGVRPTFDSGARVVEVYLLDFEGDLYGSLLSADFVAYQRPELRFDSVDALIHQMHADVVVARQNLAAHAAIRAVDRRPADRPPIIGAGRKASTP